MGKKKKKKGFAGLWERIKSNPEGVGQIMKGVGGLYAGSKGMVWNPTTQKWEKHQQNSKPPGATRDVGN